MARRSHISPAEAADRLDQVVHDILLKLRSGKSATLPGLGTFEPGRTMRFQFERPPEGKEKH